MWHKRAFLALKDNGILLNALKFMPNTLGNVHTISVIFRAEYIILNDSPVIIMSRNTYLPSQNHKGFILRGMFMDRYFRPWLNSIQATDGAARAEPCSHELCRVASEVEHRSTDGTSHPAKDGSYSSLQAKR